MGIRLHLGLGLGLGVGVGLGVGLRGGGEGRGRVSVVVARLARARQEHDLPLRRCQRRRAVWRAHRPRVSSPCHAAGAGDGQLAGAPELVERDCLGRLAAPPAAQVARAQRERVRSWVGLGLG